MINEHIFICKGHKSLIMNTVRKDISFVYMLNIKVNWLIWIVMKVN